MPYASHDGRTRECPKCGKSFTPPIKYDYVRFCFPCWQDTKAKKVEDIKRINELEVENIRLMNKIEELKNGRVATQIPSNKLVRLIRLCHPDRHNNSLISNNTTAWLLSLKK